MKKKIIIGISLCLIIVLGVLAWNHWFSRTRIAFINYQTIELGRISKANDNGMIKIDNLDVDNLDELGKYDMVFVQAMGLRITTDQRELIKKAAEKGTPVLSTMITTPENDFTSIDSVVADTLKRYLGNGGQQNYRSALNYVRKYIDRKIISAPEPDALVEHVLGLLYHPNIKDTEAEDLQFNSVNAYNAYLKKQGLWRANAPAIIVTGPMGEPRELIAKLESTGNVVYPVNSIRDFIDGNHADSVPVAAVINMAHGRMGDNMVDYLKQKNIPLFAPLNANQPEKEWRESKMGMSGGFLSQSVAMPEIDGALRTFTLFAHYQGKDGLGFVGAIPDRLETFTQTVNNYIRLKHTPNSQKHVAIYYYKGPGQNALTAGGMEVGTSLYNLLQTLRREGYNVSGLPALADALVNIIQQHGAVFGTYAKGAFERFVKTGKPALVTKTEYEAWAKRTLRPEKYAELIKANGEFPGEYLATEDGKLAIPRIRFGNVVLLPQLPAGGGGNSFKIVHGTDAAPPHPYVASYLWTQYAFKADVLIHFGTHGSLEFTPKKQIALSDADWPDRLVGATPHLYVYTVGNVGEGIIAKRRSYAGLQTYLTPPFMESEVRGTYKALADKIETYNTKVAKHLPGINETALEVKALVMKLGINRDLGLVDRPGKPYTEDEMLAIDNFTEELATEKMTGKLYTMGVPYDAQRIKSSIVAMCADPIAYSLLAIDKQRGRADETLLKHRTAFTQRYLNPAKALVEKLLANPSLANEDFIRNLMHITPAEYAKAHSVYESLNAPSGMAAMMQGKGKGMPAAMMKAMAQMAKGMDKMPKGMKQMPKGIDKMPKGTDKPKHERPKDMKSMPAKMMAKHGTKGEMPEAMRKAMQESKGEMPEAMRKAMQESKGEMPEAMRKAMQEMAQADSPKAMTHGKQMPPEMKKAMQKHGSMPHKMPKAMTQSMPPAKKDRASAMMAMGSMKMTKPTFSKREKDFAFAVMEVERTILSVDRNRKALLESPQLELRSIVNAMNGGYTAPSPGGDPIANANTLPTGRNMYSINAETTPSEAAWEQGKQLAMNTIEMYRKQHHDSLPRKVSYTLWSGEFIETQGATIAQILYMLGVEPVRDFFGRISDIKLIPSKELGRPRIDVVVQTSGQLRDLAASRLFLINRAVEMAAAAKDDKYENQVAEGVKEAERTLTAKGVSPEDARRLSTHRVFGGVNGGYGTGIQAMVLSGDRWERRAEIADTYINNMGAFYGDEKNWEEFKQYAFEAALTRTDVVIQPRQSNLWGALSLDHVYEFMGGMNIAVTKVTGKEPDAYLSDYRNHNNMRMQNLKEAIGIESRTTIFNPAYIKEQMKGGAEAADGLAKTVQNTFGWKVMRASVIDNEFWEKIYNVYVKDEYKLGMDQFFEQKNPAALEEITAVMLESARKGMWKANREQVSTLARRHVELVNRFKPSCSGFVCNNAKLQKYVASNGATDNAARQQYLANIDNIRQTAGNGKQGRAMNKETMGQDTPSDSNAVNGIVVIAVVVVAIVVLFVIVRRHRKQQKG